VERDDPQSADIVSQAVGSGLRVLAIDTDWSSAKGGVSTINRYLCTTLATLGAEVCCLVLRCSSSDVEEAAAVGVHLVVAAPVPGDEQLEWLPLGNRPSLPAGFTPDVVIGHGRVTGPAAVRQVRDHFPGCSRIQIVHTIPDEVEWTKPEQSEDAGIRAEQREALERSLCVGATLVYGVGPRIHSWLSRIFWEDEAAPRIERLDPGFDIVPSTGRPRTPPSGKPPVVLVHGRFDVAEGKGVDIASRAVARAIDLLHGSEVNLRLRGIANNKHTEIRNKVRGWADGHDRLSVTPRSFSTDITKLDQDFREASLVLMPSRAEGFGLAGLEAIARGIPTLVSENSGLADLLKDCILDAQEQRRIIVPVRDNDGRDTDQWGHQTAAILGNPEGAFLVAERIRALMVGKRTWAMAARKVIENSREEISARETVAAMQDGRDRPSPPRRRSPWRAFDDDLGALMPFTLPAVSRHSLLSRELGESAEPGRCCYVVGEGGLGKSVLIGQLARHLADAQGPSSPGTSAVVLVTCANIGNSADLSTKTGADVAFGRVAAVVPSPPESLTPDDGLTALVSTLASAPQGVFVLIDTLDLVVSEETADAISAVLADVAEEAQLVMTCRTREFEDLLQDPQTGSAHLGGRQCAALRMSSLATREIIDWASRYVQELDRTETERARFINSLSDAVSAATVREVCAVPLRLALACDLYSTGDEHVPTDLTITSLLLAYWERRILRDRRGRGGAAGRAQGMAALGIAEKILRQSTTRLVLTVDALSFDADPGLPALLGEDFVRRQAGRLEFAHQVFAEFAVARYLIEAGSDEDLEALGTALHDVHSFLWPVVRHLLTQNAPEDRYSDLQAAVPRNAPEGARDHLLGALSRNSPELLSEHTALLKENDPQLLHSLVPLLANAPAACATRALEISVPLLADIADGTLTEAARTVGTLLPRVDASTRYQQLAEALDIVDGRRTPERYSQWLNLPESLITPVCEKAFDEPLVRLLCARYEAMGVNAQRVVLRAALAARLGDPETSNPGRGASWSLVAQAMLVVELPPGMPEDEYVPLLRWSWQDATVRQHFGWPSWPELLDANLAKRWDSAQVRVVRDLAHDPSFRAELFTELFDGGRVVFWDRWINAARFAADIAPEEALHRLLDVLPPQGRDVVGAMASLAVQLAPSLDRASREQLIEALGRFAAADPRRVWPAMIGLAGPDVPLHRELYATFLDTDKERPTPEQQAVWNSARLSALETWLNAAPTAFLAEKADELRILLPDRGPKAGTRRAKLEGRISMVSEQARVWVEHSLMQGRDTAIANEAATVVRRAIEEAQSSDAVQETDWLVHLLTTPHPAPAQTFAEMIADPDRATQLPPIGPVVAARLVRAAADGGQGGLVKSLITLLDRVQAAGSLAVQDARSVIDTLTAPILTFAERLAIGVTEPERYEMTVELNRWVDAICVVGWELLPISELDPLVRRALSGWDALDLGSRAERPLKAVMRGLVGRSPEFARWLADELWLTAGTGTKSAIAEAFLAHERLAVSHYARNLARRADCPPEIAARILDLKD
jgi:glycosyltransferase involved in cell wall biosynthesis